MALLEIARLTIRFGGLTAVKDVSLLVNEREIVSIIGPNGAGKTTIFNAITGICPPTSGEIRFQGRVVAIPASWRLWLACGLVGFCAAVGLALAAINVDLFWRAAIRRTYNIDQFYRDAKRAQDPLARSFTYGEAARNAWSYLRGEIAVEPTSRSWRIVSCDGRVPLLRASNEAEARERRDALNTLLFAATPPEIRDEGEHHAAYYFRQDEQPLAVFENTTTAELEELLKQISEVRGANRTRQLFLVVGFGLGGVLGASGNYVVWRRARRSPDVISRGGIARTFQNIRLFHNMTVLENVLVGMDRRFSGNLLGMLLRWPAFRRQERPRFREAEEILSFMGLYGRRDELAKNLPYGDQRRLEIARAMATLPRLLLLDEPAAGMNPAESEDLMHLIRRIRERGITILLIEHHMKLVMGISDRIAVLEYGEAIAEGTPVEVRNNPQVIEAYLGKEEIG